MIKSLIVPKLLPFVSFAVSSRCNIDGLWFSLFCQVRFQQNSLANTGPSNLVQLHQMLKLSPKRLLLLFKSMEDFIMYLELNPDIDIFYLLLIRCQ